MTKEQDCQNVLSDRGAITQALFKAYFDAWDKRVDSR